MMPRLRHALSAVLLVAVLGLGTARGAAVANFQDQWWNAGESGWGAAVLQQWETLFVCFFVYGPDGKPTWFVAVATPSTIPSTFTTPSCPPRMMLR